MGQELDYVILICNSSVVLSQMFSGGPDLRDVDLGASHIISLNTFMRGLLVVFNSILEIV